MLDTLYKSVINLIIAFIVLYCILYSFDIGFFERTTSLNQSIPIFFIGTIYFVYTIIILMKDPFRKGYISLVSGLVIYEIYGTVVNIVFPHIMLTPYFLLWIFYYYLLSKERLKVNKGEVLLTIMILSTFISMFLSKNEYIAIGYTTFTMLTILFVALCTSRVIRIQQYKGNSFVPIISASLLNMMFFSFLYFLYEVYGSGRGISLSSYIQTNLGRTFDENKYLTAGFMEPVGFSLMAAITLVYYFAVFGIYKKDNVNKNDSFAEHRKYAIIKSNYFIFLILYSLFLLIISNSRTGYSGLFISLVVFLYLLHRYVPNQFSISKIAKISVIVIVSISVLVFIIRSANIFESFDRSSLIRGRQIDTSLSYILTAEDSIKILMGNFWGSGAFTSSGNFFIGAYSGTTNVVNIYSVLLNVGATYGWITLILNILFYIFLTVQIGNKLKNSKYIDSEKLVILAFLALVVASVLPLCPTLSLASNWTPQQSNIPILKTIFFPPRVYGAVITAISYGVLISQTNSFQHRNIVPLIAHD